MSNKKQTTPKGKNSSAVKPGHKGFFPKKSGNPAGRPPGSRNRASRVAASSLEGSAEKVMSKIIAAADKEEPWALMWLGNRLVPPCRSLPVTFELPPLESLEDILAAHDALLEAVARGEINLDDAERISGLFEAKRMAIETADLADEIEAFKVYLKVKR
jgi:hypothetical protein